MNKQYSIMVWLFTLLTSLFVLQSCCKKPQYCPDITQIEWINELENTKPLYLSNKGDTLIFLFGSIELEQQNEADYISKPLGGCFTECTSSMREVGIITYQNSHFIGPIKITFTEKTGSSAEINEEGFGDEYKFEFSGSKNKFEDPFSPQYSQVETSTDTIPNYGQITIHDYTKVPIYTRDTNKNSILFYYLSSEEGVLAFELDSNEVYYRIN